MINLRFAVVIFVFIAVVSLAPATQLATAGNKHAAHSLAAALTGAAEVPGPGDADGAGTVKITLKSHEGQVCYELAVSNIATATAAHIHTGAAGVAGPVLVVLQAPAEGSSKGCVALDKAKIRDIKKNPAAFYVNVHNAEFPNGALRGQLAK